MSKFVQIHAIAFYPPSCVNRDDNGRPKTCVVGGTTRIRVSSQSLKRAWRTSAAFADALAGNLGTRTRRLGESLRDTLVKEGVAQETATSAVKTVIGAVGTLHEDEFKKNGTLSAKELAFFSPGDMVGMVNAARGVAAGTLTGDNKIRDMVYAGGGESAVDIAMFGRMIARDPQRSVTAGVQVAHAFTTGATSVEADYYVAMDDKDGKDEDSGSAFMGQGYYASGTYYLYVNVDRDQLVSNLKGDDSEALADRAIKALVEAIATVGPQGKVASFGSNVRASFLMVEKGDGMPRTLAGAFDKPVKDEGVAEASIARLIEHRSRMAKAYPRDATRAMSLDLYGTDGATLEEVVEFAATA